MRQTVANLSPSLYVLDTDPVGDAVVLDHFVKDARRGGVSNLRCLDSMRHLSWVYVVVDNKDGLDVMNRTFCKKAVGAPVCFCEICV